MNRTYSALIALSTITAIALSSPASAQTVGAADSFAVLGGTSVTAAAGGTQTLINGDVGVSPGTSITGFPANATTVPPFGVHSNDAAAIAAQSATQTLYNELVALGAGTAIGNELGGQVYGPGTYTIGAANIAATANLTLSGAGTYIFKVGSSLTANVGSTVTLVGVDPCDVWWQVTSAATLNGVNFVGTVVAQAAVDLGSNATLVGRALTTAAGAVTLAGGNTINGCATAPVVPPVPAAGTDLIITKTHTGNFTEGTNGTYTLTVSNIGDTASAGAITVTDTLPTGLTFVSAAGTGWACSNVGQVVTCTNTAVIAPSASGAAIALVVSPGSAAVPTVTNRADVSGGGDAVLTNNSTADVTIVTPLVPPVPTMSQWATIALAGLLMMAGFFALSRRRETVAAR